MPDPYNPKQGGNIGMLHGALALLHRVDLTPIERLIALEMLDHVDKRSGCAWPGEKRLAERLGVPLRTVQRYIPRVAARLPLIVQRGGRAKGSGRGKSNRYYFTLEAFDSPILADRNSEECSIGGTGVQDSEHQCSTSGTLADDNPPNSVNPNYFDSPILADRSDFGSPLVADDLSYEYSLSGEGRSSQQTEGNPLDGRGRAGESPEGDLSVVLDALVRVCRGSVGARLSLHDWEPAQARWHAAALRFPGGLRHCAGALLSSAGWRLAKEMRGTVADLIDDLAAELMLVGAVVGSEREGVG